MEPDAGALNGMAGERPTRARRPGDLMPALTLAVSLVLGAGSGVDSARAQTAGGKVPTATIISIEVPPLILCEPGQPTRLAVALSPAAALPANSYLRIRGLPASVSPSDGHQIAAGAWAIPLDGLAQLQLTAQAGSPSKAEIGLSLLSIEGRVLAEGRSVIVVAPAGLIAPPATARLSPPPPKPVQRTAPPVPVPVPAPSALSDETRAEAQRQLERGQTQLAAGNVVAARGLFERAADLGLPEAAMAMAATFDAWELSRLGTVGVQPDAATARQWYARAQALGVTTAADRMARLPK
jgi:hypothetical protein